MIIKILGILFFGVPMAWILYLFLEAKLKKALIDASRAVHPTHSRVIFLFIICLSISIAARLTYALFW